MISNITLVSMSSFLCILVEVLENISILRVSSSMHIQNRKIGEVMVLVTYTLADTSLFW